MNFFVTLCSVVYKIRGLSMGDFYHFCEGTTFKSFDS